MTRVAVGVPYRHHLEIYNPFSEPLEVRRVTTSSPLLLLAIPDARAVNRSSAAAGGSRAAAKPSLEDAWVVEPKETRAVIVFELLLDEPGPFEGLIRLETGLDRLALPVSIRAVEGGLHHMPQSVDLGIITSPMQWRQQSIFLLNAEAVPVQVKDVTLVADRDVLDSRAVSIYWRKPLVIPAHSEAEIATLTLTASQQGQYRGQILIITNHTTGQGLVASSPLTLGVNFSATVIHGSLYYNATDTHFLNLHAVPQQQSIQLENRFGAPVKIIRWVEQLSS